LLLAALLAVGLDVDLAVRSQDAASDRCFFRVRNVQLTTKNLQGSKFELGLCHEEAIPPNSRKGRKECAVDSHPNKY